MKKIMLSTIVNLSVLSGIIFLSACSSGPVKTKLEDIPFPKLPDEARYYYQNSVMSDRSVVKETEDDKISRWLTGVGDSGKTMEKPYELAVHDGILYVSDPTARMVRLYNFKDSKYIEIGRKGANETILQKPFGIAVDSLGNLYVVDRTSQDIKVYTSEGVFLRKFGESEQYDMPTGIAVNEDGSLVYVSDTGGVTSERHQILVYNGVTGELIKTFATRGKDEEGLNLPKGLALSKKNELYVVDSGNFRVVVYDVDTGEMLRTFGSIGRQLGNFSRPKSIAVCDDGLVLVSDAAFGNIQIFTEEGQLLMFIGDRGNQLAPATYMLTSGVACGEDGIIFIADQFFRKVDIFRPASLKADEGYISFTQP